MNIFVLILLWQHILHLCTLFLVQGGKWTVDGVARLMRSINTYRVLVGEADGKNIDKGILLK